MKTLLRFYFSFFVRLVGDEYAEDAQTKPYDEAAAESEEDGEEEDGE